MVCLVYSQTLALSPADAELDAMEPVWRFLCGGAAGMAATVATYPLDLVRARMAVRGQVGDGSAPQARPLGVAGTLRGIYAAHGLRGLFRGVRCDEGQPVVGGRWEMGKL